MESIKNKIKAIIFDMDGTIVKTEHAWRAITKEFFLSKGINNISKEQKANIKNISSAGLFNTLAVIKKEFNLQESVDELLQAKMEIIKKYFDKNYIQFIDGFQDFHKKLQLANIYSSIATNATNQTLDIFNKKIKLDNFFGNQMYTLEHVNKKAKPDPAVFLHAAKQLNVKPEECVIFEDSLIGFKAAKAAGIKCIAIKNEFNLDILHHADGFISTYHDAEKELAKIASLK